VCVYICVCLYICVFIFVCVYICVCMCAWTSEEVALGRIIEVTNQIVQDQVDNPGQVSIDNYYDDNLDITFTTVNNDLITSIKDLNYILDNKPFEFVFAQKYRQV